MHLWTAKVRPHDGPVDACAKSVCLVEFSDGHLTYTESICREEESGTRRVRYRATRIGLELYRSSLERQFPHITRPEMFGASQSTKLVILACSPLLVSTLGASRQG